MNLAEDKRTQLDSIVNQMIQNKESDNNIQLVVSDFKNKYGGQPTQNKPSGEIPSSTAQLVGAGIGKGFVDIGRGIGERIGLVSPEQISESRKVDQPLMETTPGKVGHFIGSTLPWFLVPGGGRAGLAQRMAAGAGAGAVSGLIQPTTQEESPVINTILGTLFGGTTPVALAVASKVVNAIKEPVSGAVSDLSRKFGIRTTLGETLNNPIIQKAETWLENVPIIGLKGFRQKQQIEAEQAGKAFLSNYIADPLSTDIMASNRKFASSLFQGLEQTVSGIKDQAIKPTETRQVAKGLLERYPDIFKKFQDTKRESLLRNIVEDTEPLRSVGGKLSEVGKEQTIKIQPTISEQIAGKTEQITKTKKSIVGGSGISPLTITDRLSGITSKEKTLTFEEAWTLRDGLGEMIGQARKKLASGEVDQTTYGQMKSLFAAVNRDIEGWADSIGRSDVKGAIKTANDAYKQYVVKYDIIQRAMDKAEGTTGAGEMFSPKKLSTALKNIAGKDKYLKKFSPTEIDEMTGLSNIMQVVKRAGQYAENPPTGNRWGIPIVALEIGGYLAKGTAGGVGTAAGIVGGTGLMRFLTGTEAGKRIAMAASKVEPTNPIMGKIMEEIYRQVPRMVGVTGAQLSQTTMPWQMGTENVSGNVSTGIGTPPGIRITP